VSAESVGAAGDKSSGSTGNNAYEAIVVSTISAVNRGFASERYARASLRNAEVDACDDDESSDDASGGMTAFPPAAAVAFAFAFAFRLLQCGGTVPSPSVNPTAPAVEPLPRSTKNLFARKYSQCCDRRHAPPVAATAGPSAPPSAAENVLEKHRPFDGDGGGRGSVVVRERVLRHSRHIRDLATLGGDVASRCRAIVRCSSIWKVPRQIFLDRASTP